MGLINCNKMLSVGVKQFDDDHCRLVAITNQLHDAIKAGTGSQLLQSTLQQLEEFTVQHFRAEEELLESFDYPHLEDHREAHKGILNKLTQLKTVSPEVQGNAIMQFLLDWLVTHTKDVDKRYTQFLNSKGVF